jgi:hsp70-interacting protein
LNAFDELEMLVEGIDNASNMDKMNLWPVIFECLETGETLDVVRFALWIIGTCAQNNPETQSCMQEKHEIFARLLTLWQREPAVQGKIMYCFSCLLSNNPAGLEIFVASGGFGVIDKFDGDEVHKKIKFLLTILGNQVGPDAIRCLIKDCPSLVSIESEPCED